MLLDLRRAAVLAASGLLGCASGAPHVEHAAPLAERRTLDVDEGGERVALEAARSETRGRHGELVLVEASDPTLAPGSGALNFEASHPTEVWLGDRNLGTTPLAFVRLPVGTHVLALVNPATRARELLAVTVHDREVLTRRHACTGAAENDAPASGREAFARRVAP